LRPFSDSGNGLNDRLFTQNTITGNTLYDPKFKEFGNQFRISNSLGLGLAQVISKRIQTSLSLDLVMQNGLLSTPFQRVYFGDVEDSFIDNFQLADNNEQMPNIRFKLAVGGRMNFYLNEYIVVRTFYRYYTDDWGINSHTASIEIPLKLIDKFTFYPSYRFYNQTAADYFAPYETHSILEEFYTSDYDLSEYSSNQYGFGIKYTDIFTEKHIWRFGLKNIDLNYYRYTRNSGFTANLVVVGAKFIWD